ncbi:MAG: glycosyltransferase family 4 protein [Bryobacteraceae bacterium]
MKILYLITRAELGGAQVHLHDLLKGFRNSCDLLLGVGEEGYLTEAAAGLNIRHAVIPGLVQPISPLKDVQALARIARLIRSFQPDLVHAHTSKAGILGRAAARWMGVPSVFTAHTWSFAQGTSWKWKAAGIPSEKLMARCGAKTITVSEANRAMALSRGVGDRENLVTIHNGIPDTPFRAAHGLSPAPRIAMVARCARQKSQIRLLRAMAPVKLPFKISFVGDGPTRVQLEHEAARLGLTDRTEFLGNRRDIAEILAGSDIFALPTNWEGFPLSILEAMRAGLPVVASDVGGVSEAVADGETGFLTPGEDEAALRERITALLIGPALRLAMGQAGRARYERQFTLPAMIEKTLAVYRSVLARPAEDWKATALQVSGS